MSDIALSFAGLIAVGIKIISTAKFIETKDYKALAYQVGAWLVGIVLVLWGSTIQGIQANEIGGITLADMTLSTKLYIGFALGSTGSLIVDGIKAIDNNQSSKI